MIATVGTPVLLYVEIILALVVLISAVYLAFNLAALKNYKETIDSQEVLIAALREDNEKLERRVSRLEGQEKGYEFAIRLLLSELTNSDICERASTCDNRLPPQKMIDDFVERVEQNRVRKGI